MPPPTPRVTLPPVPRGQTAQRLSWRFLPRQLRSAVERRLGGEVVNAQSRESGFGTGFASVLRTADGTSVFLKAASVVAQEQAAAALRGEVRVLKTLASQERRLPMPRPLWVSDDDSWVVVGFEAVDGQPPRRPWRVGQLEQALDLAEQVADASDPLPADLDLRRDTRVQPDLAHAWEMLPDRPHREDALALAASYADLPGAALCHGELRDDNVLLGDDGSAYAVGWGRVRLAPPWRDTVDLLLSAYGDGLDVDDALTRRVLTRDVDPEHVDAWLAAVAGLMADAALRPAPLNSPHLRTHQEWYAAAAWGWLCERRGWDTA